MAIIQVENIEFYAYHGCFQEEQVVGNQFLVDILVETDTTKAQLSDKLHDTVNYQVLYNLIKEEMKIKSKLLEHVSERIINSIHSNFSEITRIRVKVSKMNPPLGGKIERVSVTLERNFA